MTRTSSTWSIRWMISILSAIVLLSSFGCGEDMEGSSMDGNNQNGTPSVSVDDQWVTNRRQVTVASVTATQQGWLVIHQDDNGSPGAVIGTTPIEPGTNADVQVTQLAEKVEQGETLYAMLHADTGTTGRFEFDGSEGSADPPVKVDGSVVVKPFQTKIPSVSVSDQQVATSDEVTVDSVRSDGPGWIVIHKNADGSPGAVIGQTQVQEGQQEDVTVALEEEVTGQQKLFAMLHDDTGEMGTYEFDGSQGSADPPIKVDESVVVQPFTLTSS